MTTPPQKTGLSILAIVLIVGGSLFAVMVLVIGILIAILLPSLTRARMIAQETRTLSNMRGISVAVVMYSNDYDGYLPPHLAAALPYGISPQTLRDPRTSLPPMPTPTPGTRWESLVTDVDSHCDFDYLGGGLRMSRIGNATMIPILIARTPNRLGNWLIAFADGRVETIPTAFVSRYMNELNIARLAAKLPPLTLTPPIGPLPPPPSAPR